MLIRDIVDQFLLALRDERNLAKNTISSYKRDLRQFTNYLLRMGINDLKLVNQLVIRSYIQHLNNAFSLKPSSIGRKIACLKSFFKYCVQAEVLSVNPMDRIPMPKKVQTLPICLTEDEARRFISMPIRYRNKPEWISKRDEAVLKLLYHEGVRGLSEVLSIKLEDLDLNSGELRIRESKGGPRPPIPLADLLIKSIREYLAVRPRVNCPYLFLATDKRTKLGKPGFYKLFKAHLKRAKINRPEITPHKIRATAATILYRETKDILSIQKLLGHKSLETTRRYIDCSMEDVRRLVNSHPIC